MSSKIPEKMITTDADDKLEAFSEYVSLRSRHKMGDQPMNAIEKSHFPLSIAHWVG